MVSEPTVARSGAQKETQSPASRHGGGRSTSRRVVGDVEANIRQVEFVGGQPSQDGARAGSNQRTEAKATAVDLASSSTQASAKYTGPDGYCPASMNRVGVGKRDPRI